MGLFATSAWNDAKNGCNPTSCLPQNRPSAESDRNNAVMFSTLSDVGFAAGGALVVLGGILIWTAPQREQRKHPGRLAPRPLGSAPRAQIRGLQGEFEHALFVFASDCPRAPCRRVGPFRERLLGAPGDHQSPGRKRAWRRSRCEPDGRGAAPRSFAVGWPHRRIDRRRIDGAGRARRQRTGGELESLSTGPERLRCPRDLRAEWIGRNVHVHDRLLGERRDLHAGGSLQRRPRRMRSERRVRGHRRGHEFVHVQPRLRRRRRNLHGHGRVRHEQRRVRRNGGMLGDRRGCRELRLQHRVFGRRRGLHAHRPVHERKQRRMRSQRELRGDRARHGQLHLQGRLLRRREDMHGDRQLAPRAPAAAIRTPSAR